MRLVELLWQAHTQVAPYPPGVLPVPTPIPGNAFFPVGYGLWIEADHPSPDIPVGGVMVLGHDFHSETGYRASLERDAEAMTQRTWRALLPLLASAGIAREASFFTNVFMGLRAGSGTTGRFRGAGNAPFVARCVEFLAQQLAAQRPRLILALGRFLPPLLALLSPDLEAWRGAQSLKQVDAAGALQPAGRFALPGQQTIRAAVAALTHPSFRHASARQSSYLTHLGADAEPEILRTAMPALRLAPSA